MRRWARRGHVSWGRSGAVWSVMMADVLVRVGICGLGVAARQVRSSIDRTEGAQLTAVCDVRPNEVRDWCDRYDLEGFTDINELVKSNSVDAVWVATPN